MRKEKVIYRWIQSQILIVKSKKKNEKLFCDLQRIGSEEKKNE